MSKNKVFIACVVVWWWMLNCNSGTGNQDGFCYLLISMFVQCFTEISGYCTVCCLRWWNSAVMIFLFRLNRILSFLEVQMTSRKSVILFWNGQDNAPEFFIPVLLGLANYSLFLRYIENFYLPSSAIHNNWVSSSLRPVNLLFSQFCFNQPKHPSHAKVFLSQMPTKSSG